MPAGVARAAYPARYAAVAGADELEVLDWAMGAAMAPAAADDALNASAWRLGRLVGAGLLPRSEAERKAAGAARAHGLDPRSSARTITRALDAGAGVPRVPLPPPEGQVRRCSIPLAQSVGTLSALMLWHAHHLQERAEAPWFRYSRRSWQAAFPWCSGWTVDAELDQLMARGLLRCREVCRGGCVQLHWQVNDHHELAAHLHGPSVAIPLADLVRLHQHFAQRRPTVRNKAGAQAQLHAALLAVLGLLAARGSHADPDAQGTVRISAAELAPLLPPIQGHAPPSLPTVRAALRELVALRELTPGPDDGQHHAPSYRPNRLSHHRAGRAPHKDNPSLPQDLQPCAGATDTSSPSNTNPQSAANEAPAGRSAGLAVYAKQGEPSQAKQKPSHEQNRAASRPHPPVTAPSAEQGGLEGFGVDEVGILRRRPPSPHRAMLAELLAVCGLSTSVMSRREQGGAGKAAADLLRYGASPADLAAAAERYRALFPDAWCTPLALRKHWFALRSSDEKLAWSPPVGPVRDLLAELTVALGGETWSQPRAERDFEREERDRLIAEEAERARQLALLSAGSWTRKQADEDCPTPGRPEDRVGPRSARTGRFEELLKRWGRRGAGGDTTSDVV